MPSPRPPPPALSAPGLIGSNNSILNPSATLSSSKHRGPKRPYAHARLEIDLSPDPAADLHPGWIDRLEGVLPENKIVEGADVLRLASRALHAFSAEGFRQVDHWETEPGGWLPIGPPPSGGGEPEPLGTLLRELDRDHWDSIKKARVLSFRLSHPGGNRADVVVRRVHRRRHALTIDLWGRWEREHVRALAAALTVRMAVRKVTLTRYRYS